MTTRTTRPTPGHAALRKGRHSQPQRVYLITFTTQGRQPLFADFDLACVAVRALCEPANWQDARLLAWVLMPDHWHGLVELGHERQLSCLVQSLKARSSNRIRIAHPSSGPVWARSFHDRALRHEENLVTAARYLVVNPIRAGLASRIRDYPFWDAVWLE